MKKIIFLFVISALLFSCNPKEDKPEATKVEKKEMSYAEVSKLLGADIAFKIFDSAGKTEADPNPVARGAKKPKNNATVIVWSADLVLTGDGVSLTYTTSPNAYIGGVNRYTTIGSMDGAAGIWSCNRWWSGVVESSVTCSDSPPAGTSYYIAFTSDRVTYDIHVSNTLTVNN